MVKITTTGRQILDETAAIIAAAPTVYPFRLWRTIPAADYDLFRRLAVAAYVAECATGDVEWRRAIAGDATCAIRIALRMEVPDEITFPVDATMTLLMYSALDGSAAAGLVLAHLLRRMPIDAPLKHRLATSWLVRNLGLACPSIARPRRRAAASRPAAAASLGRSECAS
ncbi:MAG: hypothetical protein GY844_11525 [Bradyrhizobium sp.]|nr:hypothetical protein [Bradyrhizobium sp.]